MWKVQVHQEFLFDFRNIRDGTVDGRIEEGNIFSSCFMAAMIYNLMRV